MNRIVEVIPTLSMGGAESMVRDYCLLIDKEKFDVSIIVLSENVNTPISCELEKNGVNVIYIAERLHKDIRFIWVQKAVRFVLKYYRFRKAIKTIKPDVIHLHLQIGLYMRIVPINKLGSRLLLTVHNVPERYFSRNIRKTNKYIEYKEVSRLIHKQGMTLLTLHDGLNKELRSLFNTNRVLTVYNGIRIEKFNPKLYDRSQSREVLGVEDQEIVIGHVGSMHPQKNHDLILKVFDAFHRINKMSKLLLVGEGKLKNEIIDKIDEMGLEDSVIILSNRDDVPRLMNAMDVFLFPSRWEGFGNVLIEAQSMGLPCVVSDVVPRDVRITDRVHVVKLNATVDEWVNKVIYALNGNPGLEQINTKELFDMNRCIKELEKIYSDVR